MLAIASRRRASSGPFRSLRSLMAGPIEAFHGHEYDRRAECLGQFVDGCEDRLAKPVVRRLELGVGPAVEECVRLASTLTAQYRPVSSVDSRRDGCAAVASNRSDGSTGARQARDRTRHREPLVRPAVGS